jgi:hypothetical protein
MFMDQDQDVSCGEFGVGNKAVDVDAPSGSQAMRDPVLSVEMHVAHQSAEILFFRLESNSSSFRGC